jgi:hypothetical protein
MTRRHKMPKLAAIIWQAKASPTTLAGAGNHAALGPGGNVIGLLNGAKMTAADGRMVSPSRSSWPLGSGEQRTAKRNLSRPSPGADMFFLSK